MLKRSNVVVSVIAVVMLGMAAATEAQVAPPLGAAAQFGVLGNSSVTGATGSGVVVTGDVGSSPNASISNFPPSSVAAPFILHNSNDGVVSQAHADAVVAYNQLQAQGSGTVLADNLGVAGALGPGIYSFTTGAPDLPAGATLTLNGNGIFIFNVGSSLTMNVNSNFAGTASGCNIYWRVGSSATLNGTSFRGTVIANTSITVGAGSSLFGRALAGTGASGAVTMAGNGGNTIGGCSSASSTPTPPPGTTVGVCADPSKTPPTITSMNPQRVAVNESITVFFNVTGSIIPNALQITATSSDLGVVPLSGIVVTQPTVGGETTVRLTPVSGVTGTTTIRVQVRDPSTDCINVASFVLGVGVAAVPTLAQWAQITLASLLLFSAYVALRRRETIARVH